MKIPQRLIVSVLLLSVAAFATGCGDTWRGVKEDTGRNLEKAGKSVQDAGEKVKSD
ncbi:MAG: hypothetical protein NXI13_15215 [Proteobacteria bacterium]|jgi:predicted small secreted protein|nr:hypothetical protein [Pseudomonadota bacterium]